MAKGSTKNWCINEYFYFERFNATFETLMNIAYRATCTVIMYCVFGNGIILRIVKKTRVLSLLNLLLWILLVNKFVHLLT